MQSIWYTHPNHHRNALVGAWARHAKHLHAASSRGSHYFVTNIESETLGL